MKNFLSKVMCFCMVMFVIFTNSPIASVIAEENIKVVLNGTELSFDVPPQLINDRTMVPMRRIFEALGASVEWEDETQTVTAKKDDTLIKMQIDNEVIFVNTQEITLDVPPQLVGDRTLVPVRAVAEGMGADVNWVEETQTVVIIKEEIPDAVPSSIPTPTIEPTPDATTNPTTVTFYDVNDSIPDYGSITGKSLYGKAAPDNFSRSWQYSYLYDESDLKKYTDYLQKNGFIKSYSGKTQPGTDVNYYSDGVEGLFTAISNNNEIIYIVLFNGGTAEDVITSKSDKNYKENSGVPNYGYLTDTEPIRFDAGYTAAGTETAIYLYPYSGNIVSNEYDEKLKENGWKLAGNMPIITNGALTKVTYIKDGELMGVVTDRYLKMITVSFEITNEQLSKPPM